MRHLRSCAAFHDLKKHPGRARKILKRQREKGPPKDRFKKRPRFEEKRKGPKPGDKPQGKKKKKKRRWGEAAGFPGKSGSPFRGKMDDKPTPPPKTQVQEQHDSGY